MSKNALEFFQVVEILSPYLTTFNLSQINHDMSTQVNDALNKSMTSLASKDRLYNGSCSLAGRQSIVVMKRNEGHGKYLDDICRKIDVQRHGGIQWLSHQIEKTVSKKRLRSMESSSKCQRSSKKRRARSTLTKKEIKDEKKGLSYKGNGEEMDVAIDVKAKGR